MAPCILKEFILQCDIDTFLKSFWLDNAWYERFLVQKLEDINVHVGEWTTAQEAVGFMRNVRSSHPSKLSFPGLPSHAESLKTHIYQLIDNGNYLTVSIKESNTFRGIPYSDYFGVNTEWVVISQNRASSMTSSTGRLDGEGCECSVKIMLDIVFHKSTWLQGTIEANTKAELLDVYELWQSSAEEHLSLLRLRVGDDDYANKQQQQQQQQQQEQGETTTEVIDIETASSRLVQQHDVMSSSTIQLESSRSIISNNLAEPPPPVLTRTTSRSSMSSAAGRRKSPRIPLRINSRQSHSGTSDNRSDCDSRGSGTSVYGSDDELQFYDCDEDADGLNEHHSNYILTSKDFERNFLVPISLADVAAANAGLSGRNARGNGAFGMPLGLLGVNNRPLTTPEKLRLLYADHGIDLSHSNVQHSPSARSRGQWPTAPGNDMVGGETSAKDLAVSVVETLFVLAEFSFWKIHRLYTHDLKVLFDIAPAQVWTRILNSFIPGWHSPLLLKPDLYGPLIAVFIMPQILLLSMGVTRHGCNQTSLLGNAVIVSLCLWCGLSALYRLLAFVIAPTINMRHCLSVTGYSFFAWDLALLLLYPMEIYQEYTNLPAMLPLVLFGLPSSLAQGCMFWEHTPASSLEVQPARFPSSLQQCAQQHVRSLQRLAWAIPKILAFVLVTGTHYQFLWYVARVFLPGKKELCQLSALMQPSQYADIITQKELRKYAQMLLSGRKAHDD